MRFDDSPVCYFLRRSFCSWTTWMKQQKEIDWLWKNYSCLFTCTYIYIYNSFTALAFVLTLFTHVFSLRTRYKLDNKSFNPVCLSIYSPYFFILDQGKNDKVCSSRKFGHVFAFIIKLRQADWQYDRDQDLDLFSILVNLEIRLGKPSTKFKI